MNEIQSFLITYLILFGSSFLYFSGDHSACACLVVDNEVADQIFNGLSTSSIMIFKFCFIDCIRWQGYQCHYFMRLFDMILYLNLRCYDWARNSIQDSESRYTIYKLLWKTCILQMCVNLILIHAFRNSLRHNCIFCRRESWKSSDIWHTIE